MERAFSFADTGPKFADFGEAGRDDHSSSRLVPSRDDIRPAAFGEGDMMTGECGKAVRNHFHDLAIYACRHRAEKGVDIKNRTSLKLKDPILNAIRAWSACADRELERARVDEHPIDRQSGSFFRLTGFKLDPESASTGIFACERLPLPDETATSAELQQSRPPLISWTTIIDQAYKDPDQLSSMHLLSNQLSGYRQCCGRKPIVHYLDDTGTELSWGAILRLPPGSAGILVVRPEPLDDFRARSVEEQTGPVGRYLGTRSPLEMTPAQGDGRLFDAQGPRSLVARGFSFTDDRAQRSSLYAQIGHYTLTNLTHPNAPDGLIFPPNPLEVCLLPRRSASSLGRSNEMCAWKDGHIDDRHQRFLVVAATLQPGVSKKNLMSLGQVEVKSSLMQPILDWAEELRDSKGLPLRCKTETHAEKIETGGSDAYTIHSTTDDLHLCLREFYLRHPDDPHDHDRVTFLAQWIRYPDSRFQGSSFTIDPNDSMPVTWHRIFDSAQRNPGFLASLLAASIAVHPHRTSVSVLVEYRNAQSELCTHDELADVRAGDTCSLTLARGPTLHPVATVTRAGKSGTADTSVRSVQSVSAASTAALAVSRDPARFSEMFPVIGNQESGPDSPHMADEVATPSRKGPSTDGLTWANVVQGRSQGPEKGQADGGPEGQRGKLGEAETSGVLAQAGAADEISSATESEEPVCAAPESTTAAPSWARILRDGKATSNQDGQRPETSSQKTQSGKAGVSWARIVGRAV